jgi:hypothetical protein
VVHASRKAHYTGRVTDSTVRAESHSERPQHRHHFAGPGTFGEQPIRMYAMPGADDDRRVRKSCAANASHNLCSIACVVKVCPYSAGACGCVSSRVLAIVAKHANVDVRVCGRYVCQRRV